MAAYQAKMAQATAATTAFGSSTLKAAADNKAGFTTLGIAAVAFGGALAFGLKSATDKALEFEDNLTKMRTLVGLSATEVNKLGEAALGLADTGVGPIELSDALYFITSSGIRGANALKVLEASAKASAIGLGETGVIADALTSAINAYGSENLTAARAADILAEAVNQGKIEADELAPVLGNILPLASALGISFEDVAGTLAVLSLKGTDAAEGATQVSAVLSSLLATTPKVTDALATVGLTMEQLRQVASEDGLVGVMNLLNEAFHGNVEELRQVFPNIRAFRAVMNALSGDSAQTAAVLDAVANSTGTVDKAFRDWGETAVAAKAKFSASFEAMQVVLGSVFLPVLAKVFDAFRGFADFVTNLPGPVRAVAVGLIAVAASLLLIGGAALLALPRIVAMQTALQSVSGTGIGKALGGTASFLTGPWGVAIAAATVGLGIWAAKQEEARRRIEELTQAIEADSGALGANTKEVVVNRLERDNWLQLARKAGIDLTVLTDAVLGDADAQKELNAQLAAASAKGGEFAGAAELLGEKVRSMNGEVDEASAAAQREAEAISGSSDEHARLTDLTVDSETALKGMEEALAETKKTADALTTSLELLAGAQIGETKASLDWLNSLADLRAELADGTKTLKSNTEEGRKNQSAILDSIDAALAHGEAVAQETGSVEKGARAVSKHIEQLVEQAKEAGISEKAIRDYIAQLNLTPEQIKTAIRLLGVDSANNQMSRFFETWNGRAIEMHLQVTSPTQRDPFRTPHAGGLVGSSGARRYHAGGLVGGHLRSDERFLVAQVGEGIIPRSLMRSTSSARPAASSPSPVPSLPSGDLVIQIEGQTLARIARSELLKLKGSRVSLGLS